MLCRPAQPADAPRMAEIHAHYVRNTAITFVCTPPTAASFAAKLADLSPRYPFLVAEEDGEVIGFAYASPLRPHDAYRWDVELSLYLAPDRLGRGAGTALMERLLRLLRRQGFLNAYSCITVPNDRSMALHRRFGFAQVGLFPHAGYKLNAWHGVCWLCKALGGFDGVPPEPTPFSALTESEVSVLLQ